MLFSRRRSVSALFLSWAIYWAAIAVWRLGPAALAIWRATRGPDTGSSSVSFNFSNFVWSLVVNDHGRATWSGSAHLATIALWIAGVPLLLWLMWATAGRSSAEPVVSEETRRRPSRV